MISLAVIHIPLPVEGGAEMVGCAVAVGGTLVGAWVGASVGSTAVGVIVGITSVGVGPVIVLVGWTDVRAGLTVA